MSTVTVANAALDTESASATYAAGLFVIWEAAGSHRQQILADLQQRFEIISIFEVHWTPACVMANFQRFYSDIDVRGVYHIFNKGAGPFTLVTVFDPRPVVELRETSRGVRRVNARFLDAKQTYRDWTRGLEVHCSETPEEVHRDTMMLLGVTVDNCQGHGRCLWKDEVLRLERDISGAHGWASLDEMFRVLNASTPYALLNWRGRPLTELPIAARPAFELLTSDLPVTHRILNASPTLQTAPHGGNFRINVAGMRVTVALRFPGDRYFDARSAQSLLQRRVMDGAGFYRLAAPDVGRLSGAEWRGGIVAISRRLAGRAQSAWWYIHDRALLRMPWWRNLKRTLTGRAATRRSALMSVVAATLKRFGGHRLRLAALFVRGVLFLGRRYRCPCCDWPLRAFTGKWGLRAATRDGYCPRCNAKARHRRLWRYLRRHSPISAETGTLLEVAPWWSLSRRFLSMPQLQYLGLDLVRTGPHVNVIGNIESTPLASNCVDKLLCIHVLEHVHDDRKAIAEIFRLLKPGGEAIISVPLRIDRPTIEDPSITDPEIRKQLFGERGHVRYYGMDITERLEAVGFRVRLDLGSQVPPSERDRYGIRDDENIFHCTRPDTIRRAGAASRISGRVAA